MADLQEELPAPPLPDLVAAVWRANVIRRALAQMSQVWTERISHPSKAAASINMSRANSFEELASQSASATSPKFHSRLPSLDTSAMESLGIPALKALNPHPTQHPPAMVKAAMGRGPGVELAPSEAASSISGDLLKAKPAPSPDIGNAPSESISAISTQLKSRAQPSQQEDRGSQAAGLDQLDASSETLTSSSPPIPSAGQQGQEPDRGPAGNLFDRAGGSQIGEKPPLHGLQPLSKTSAGSAVKDGFLKFSGKLQGPPAEPVELRENDHGGAGDVGSKTDPPQVNCT